MRYLMATIALLCPLAANAAPIDLDAPGALRKLELGKPSHHARVMKLVRAAQSAPCREQAFMRLQAALDARDLDCSLLIQTSLPPRQRVTFELDGAQYTTVVELQYVTPIVR